MFEIPPAAIRPCRHHVYSAEPLCLAIEITGFQEQWSDLPEDVPDTFAKHFKGAILASVSSLPAPSKKHSFCFAIYLFYCTCSLKDIGMQEYWAIPVPENAQCKHRKKRKKNSAIFLFCSWLIRSFKREVKWLCPSHIKGIQQICELDFSILNTWPGSRLQGSLALWIFS